MRSNLVVILGVAISAPVSDVVLGQAIDNPADDGLADFRKRRDYRFFLLGKTLKGSIGDFIALGSWHSRHAGTTRNPRKLYREAIARYGHTEEVLTTVGTFLLVLLVYTNDIILSKNQRLLLLIQIIVEQLMVMLGLICGDITVNS